jgi:hypothetical protein
MSCHLPARPLLALALPLPAFPALPGLPGLPDVAAALPGLPLPALPELAFAVPLPALPSLPAVGDILPELFCPLD